VKKKILSEREEILLKWIVTLIDVINRYSVFFGLINRDVQWLDKMWEDDDIKGKQDELIDLLQKEYGVSLVKITNKEVLSEEN